MTIRTTYDVGTRELSVVEMTREEQAELDAAHAAFKPEPQLSRSERFERLCATAGLTPQEFAEELALQTRVEIP